MKPADAGPRHWALAAMVVSLDLVDPYLPLMGLGGLDAAALRVATRAALVRQREPSHPDPRETWLEEVDRALGTTARVVVERWALSVFETAPGDHPEWVAWQGTFLMCGTRKEFDRIGLPKAHVPALWEAYKRARDESDVHALGERTRGRPLSDWDLEACALHGLFPDDEGSLLSLWLGAAVQNHRFQIFFGEVTRRLDDAELEALWRRGQEIRQAHNADPGRLVDPRTLAAGWKPS